MKRVGIQSRSLPLWVFAIVATIVGLAVPIIARIAVAVEATALIKLIDGILGYPLLWAFVTGNVVILTVLQALSYVAFVLVIICIIAAKARIMWKLLAFVIIVAIVVLLSNAGKRLAIDKMTAVTQCDSDWDCLGRKTYAGLHCESVCPNTKTAYSKAVPYFYFLEHPTLCNVPARLGDGNIKTCVCKENRCTPGTPSLTK